MAGRAFHADGDIGRGFVPEPIFGRAVQPPLPPAGCGARWMVADEDRLFGQPVHVAERLYHPGLAIAGGIGGESVAFGEAGFNLAQLVPLGRTIGHDQAGMLPARHIELHAVEQGKVRHRPARRDDIGPGPRVVQRRMMGPAMIGRDHPVQPELPRLLRIHEDAVAGIAADDRSGRSVGMIGIDGIMRAVNAVHMMIACQPLALRRLGRLCRRGCGQAEADEGRKEDRQPRHRIVPNDEDGLAAPARVRRGRKSAKHQNLARTPTLMVRPKVWISLTSATVPA